MAHDHDLGPKKTKSLTHCIERDTSISEWVETEKSAQNCIDRNIQEASLNSNTKRSIYNNDLDIKHIKEDVLRGDLCQSSILLNKG